MSVATLGDPTVNKVCLVTGVGEGTGTAIARRFATDGYRVAMLARDSERLAALEGELSGSRAFPLDIADLDRLVEVCREVRDEIGVPDVVVHNAVRATFATWVDAKVDDLERNFRVNTTSLFSIVRELAPDMVRRGQGAIVVTGNTSALRGIPNCVAFAPTKAAQRILAQSLARDLGPKGIHVAYVVIDAVINVPWTRDPSTRTNPQRSSANRPRLRTRCITWHTNPLRSGLSTSRSVPSARIGSGRSRRKQRGGGDVCNGSVASAPP